MSLWIFMLSSTPFTAECFHFVVEFDPSCEALLFTTDGVTLHGADFIASLGKRRALTLVLQCPHRHHRRAQLGQGWRARVPRGPTGRACHTPRGGQEGQL